MNLIEQIKAEIAPFHLLHHPFYQDWNQGKLSSEKLMLYAQQYYHQVAAFPCYISAVHSQCKNAQDRRVLLENLNEEEGSQGKPHPELWLDFAEALGLDRHKTQKAKPLKATCTLVDTFVKLSRHSYAKGLAALYAYEYQVPEIAETKINGLVQHYGLTQEKQFQFFTVHREADVWHREACEALVNQLNSSDEKEAVNGAKEAAQSLWDFLTAIHTNESLQLAC